MKYDNYIFDLDGTLLNTIEDLAASCNYALRNCDMPEHTVPEIQSFVGNGIRKLMERCVPQGVNNPKFEQAYSLFRTYYLAHNAVYTRPYDGISELLKILKSSGKGIAVVSNKFDPATKALTKQYFGDDITVAIGESESIRKKPSPDMVYEAIRQLSCTADKTLYIGDSDVDIVTAKNSSLPCASVLWGFRDRSFLIAHGATVLLSHPQDVIDL
ncbi:MAG: HAD family hydrolase [Prevotella sp.]|jgi:phosphoglycolate phosphatase